MINLEEFLISQEIMEKISDESFLSQQLEEGKTLQELFGFSNEATAEFYGAAKNILEQQRYEDAISAFFFLTGINPYISDFWSGLGMAQQKNNEHEAALESYQMACELKEKEIFPYALAAQCCMEMKDFDKAIEILKTAETYAEEHRNDEVCKKLKEDAAAAKEYVLEQQRKKS